MCLLCLGEAMSAIAGVGRAVAKQKVVERVVKVSDEEQAERLKVGYC